MVARVQLHLMGGEHAGLQLRLPKDKKWNLIEVLAAKRHQSSLHFTVPFMDKILSSSVVECVGKRQTFLPPRELPEFGLYQGPAVALPKDLFLFFFFLSLLPFIWAIWVRNMDDIGPQ